MWQICHIRFVADLPHVKLCDVWQICHINDGDKPETPFKTDRCVTWLALIDVANLPRATYPTYSYVPRDKGEILSASK